MPSSKKKNPKVTSLHHWPPAERPRERLFRHGVQSLSDAELLALFIRSGLPGENARDLALRLLKNSEGLRGLARKSPTELLDVAGLGPAKAAALLASFEIGKRLLQERTERRPFIEGAEDVFELLKHSLSHEREEILMGVLLNGKNEVIKTVAFSRGDSTQIVVSVPSVIRRLLLENASAVVFVHNHPSGDPTPSPEDVALTERLALACRSVEISCHDHLIFGDRRFFSFAREGKMPEESL
ncbi:MAG: DNA repair protein RadC [bacterium]